MNFVTIRTNIRESYNLTRELEIGQITDDPEMTLALLRSIIANKGYFRESVILSYLQWANSGGFMMGKNTRALLK